MANAAPSVGGEQEQNGAASAADVREQLDRLSRDVSELTKLMAAYGSAKVGEASASARESVLSFEQDLENHIRARPLQAVGIAAAAGFVAALLTRR